MTEQTKTLTMKRIDIHDAVGKGYDRFWNFKGRYRVIKGSRASKKSKTAALWFIYNLRKYPLANLLVVRRTYASLERSCYTELKWAAERLGVSKEFIFKTSPLEITRKRTGQKIFFKGLDDPMKLTSISVCKGVLCWLWCEEAFEIASEEDFNMIDELIRGTVPDGYFKQLTLTFNPWSEHHWLKKRFFDSPPSKDVFRDTTTYKTNEFLDESDIRMFEEMKKSRPERYRTAGLGEWGATSGLIYPAFEVADFDPKKLLSRSDTEAIFGLDFGYTNDPTALFCGIICKSLKSLYVFDEIYERGLTCEALASILKERGFGKARIIADSAEPRLIDELREMGIRGIRAASKGKGSILNGIDRIQRFKITVSPLCKNFISEIRSYVWETDRGGYAVNRPVSGGDHLMDAMRYAVAEATSESKFSF